MMKYGKIFFNARKTVIPQRQTNCVLPVFRRYQVSDSLAVLFVCLLIRLTFRARLHFLNIHGVPSQCSCLWLFAEADWTHTAHKRKKEHSQVMPSLRGIIIMPRLRLDLQFSKLVCLQWQL